MLDLKYIRSHLGDVREMLANRHYDLEISAFEEIDAERRRLLPALEELRHRRNDVSQEIAALKKRGADAIPIIKEMKAVAAQIKDMEAELSHVEERLKPLLMVIPNMPHESVPVGADETANPVLRTWGEIKATESESLQHWDIGEKLGILDLARASKIAGARFALYRGAGAALERALQRVKLAETR